MHSRAMCKSCEVYCGDELVDYRRGTNPKAGKGLPFCTYDKEMV